MSSVRIPPRKKVIVANSPSGVISDAGKNEIGWYLENKLNLRLPYWWEWTSKVPNNAPKQECRKYVGSFPKRIGKYFHAITGRKVSSEELGEIGSLVDQYSDPKRNNLVFDFTDDFSWKSGAFGDKGSCFWGDNAEAIPTMENAGVLAVRFYSWYKSEKCNKGFARAWFYPTFITRRRSFILFNGYGMQTCKIAYILSRHFKCDYRRISITNGGETSGLIYINGGIGYLLGQADIISNVKKHELRIKTLYSECIECGRQINYECGYLVKDKYYCDTCFHKRFYSCWYCGKYCARKDKKPTYVYTTDHIAHAICECCEKKYNFVECDFCHSLSVDYTYGNNMRFKMLKNRECLNPNCQQWLALCTTIAR